jgi:hypothetical protein
MFQPLYLLLDLRDLGWMVKFGKIELDSQKAKSYIPQIINIYNDRRPHLSINLLTPTQAHQMQGELKRLWKNYPKKNRFVCDERSGYGELST